MMRGSTAYADAAARYPAYNVPMSVEQHRKAAPARVGCAVLTISDTRTEATDGSGRAIVELLQTNGHTVVARAIVPDDVNRIRAVIEEWLERGGVEVILTTGGTGISRRDSTYEVVQAMLEKHIEGFGELFRVLSYEQIGAAAMLSRACAGVLRGCIIFAMPGSEQAVRLAMTKLVLPEIGHSVREVAR